MSDSATDELDRYLIDLVRADGSLEADALATLLPLTGERTLVAHLTKFGVLKADAERTLEMMRRGYLRGTAGELLLEDRADQKLAAAIARAPKVAPDTSKAALGSTTDNPTSAPSGTTLRQLAASGSEPAAASRSLPEDDLEYYFTLAGSTDSISMHEIVQLFSSGRHTGCLSMESPDTTMHLHLQNGIVTFLDPLQVRRRVYPIEGQSQPLTIPADVLERTVAARRETKRPILLGLLGEGAIDPLQLRCIAEPMGAESLFSILCETDPVFFMFRPHVGLPAGAAELNVEIEGISLLLEASRIVDEHRRLTASWPSRGAHIVPAGNLLTRVADLDVRREDMRFLAAIEGGNDIAGLAKVTGLSLIDIYRKVAEFVDAGVLLLDVESAGK